VHSASTQFFEEKRREGGPHRVRHWAKPVPK
jgi:hypothetical protein